MRKKVLVPVGENFDTLRKRSLVNGIAYWADRRDIAIDIRPISDIQAKKYDSNDVAFCYKALTSLPNRALLAVPSKLPLVVDTAIPLKANTENVFRGRRLALRNAFATPVATWRPELQVPMLAPPLWDDGSSVRDTIVFDVKNFHDVETHLYVASLLAAVAQLLPKLEQMLGMRLKVYFTSFFDYRLYGGLLARIASDKSLACAGKDLWSDIESRVVPPADDHEQYLNILKCSRLLITENGDIVDSDVAHSLCCGIPTLTYKRSIFSGSSGFQCCAIKGISILDPLMPMKIDFANSTRVREEWGLLNALTIGKVPAWDVHEYETLFLKSWDMVLEWALNGTADEALNVAMTKGRWNKGVQIDNPDFQRAAAIARFSGGALPRTSAILNKEIT